MPKTSSKSVLKNVFLVLLTLNVMAAAFFLKRLFPLFTQPPRETPHFYLNVGDRFPSYYDLSLKRVELALPTVVLVRGIGCGDCLTKAEMLEDLLMSEPSPWSITVLADENQKGAEAMFAHLPSVEGVYFVGDLEFQGLGIRAEYPIIYFVGADRKIQHIFNGDVEPEALYQALTENQNG